MSKLLDLGFSTFDKGYREHGEAIVAQLSQQQLTALRELETYRREYFTDLKEFARREALAIVDADADAEEMKIAFTVATADLALRMSDKFQLQMAEIIVFGERQGDLPELETSRILHL